MGVQVWTYRRKLLGNLIPAIFWFPPLAFGLVLMVVRGQVLGAGLWFLVLATILGWFALNQFGYFENGRMRRQLERILTADDAKLPPNRNFVGFSTPKYSGLLDAHEDVGFLCFLQDQVLFVSETRTVEISRAEVKEVRFRPNPHTVMGLGRWISIEAERHGKPIRMLVECRDRKTMLANMRASASLLSKIKRWQKEPLAN